MESSWKRKDETCVVEINGNDTGRKDKHTTWQEERKI